jgi:anthranilate synthase component I
VTPDRQYMTIMTPEHFAELTQQGYNRIPLMRELLADLDTPLSAYLKLANRPYSYLFESVQGGEKWGRYSFIGLPAATVVRITDQQIEVEKNGVIVNREQVEDPLAWVETLRDQFRVPSVAGLPRFTGGLVGYFGYDIVRHIEPRLRNHKTDDPLQCPDIVLMVSEDVVVFDNLKGKVYLICHADPASPDAYAQGLARLQTLEDRLGQPLAKTERTVAPRTVNEQDFVSGFTRERFEQAVLKCKEYIREGDVMQVVLSQRLTIPFHAPPIDLYRALRCLNPSPYMYYLTLGDFAIVGSSPEILVRQEDNVVTVRPIAGTRRRGATIEEDLALEQELLADPKELAEHLMLIDLGRNDVGRVAELGSVKLTDKMVIERYSHVMHIVSNVIGKVDASHGPMDVLRATFPAGTVSGAPKIRAMEIIDELEPVKRGVYAGAVGYLSWSGNIDTAIAIRTAVIKAGELHIQAGAGIVADSIPALEWDETMNKGRAIFRAVAMAESGLSVMP